MDESTVIDRLSALAQPTRLAVFRHLAAAYPGEVPAGDIARHCDVPHNTMSSHLAVLTRAGLTEASRDGRSVRYRAKMGAVQALVRFLTLDCCEGHPELCVSLLADLAAPSCPPAANDKKASHG